MSSSTSPSSTMDKAFLTIEIGDLLSHGPELGDSLASFLTEKLSKQIKVSRAEKEVYVRSEGKAHISKTKLRVYLKRFLHLNSLREDLKIISRSKDRFAIIEFITIIYEESD
jgi:hypothetical protein